MSEEAEVTLERKRLQRKEEEIWQCLGKHMETWDPTEKENRSRHPQDVEIFPEQRLQGTRSGTRLGQVIESAQGAWLDKDMTNVWMVKKCSGKFG